MRSLLELGLVSWINQNPEMANKLQLRSPDTDNPALLQAFLSKAPVAQEDLEKLGADAQEIGTAGYTTERVFKLPTGPPVRILHALQGQWRAVDGTVMQGRRDTERRYLYGPLWSRNSCAIDVVLFAAILLDAGRTQIDQICFTSESHLNTVAALTRYIVSKPWGLLSSKQRSAMRDVLAQQLSAMDARRFPLHEYINVDDVVGVALAGLPQLSHTWCVARMCCDQVLRLPDKPEIERTTGFHIGLSSPHATVQSGLREALGNFKEREIRRACSVGDKCTREAWRQRIILDRMPPLLLVGMGGKGAKRRDSQQMILSNLNLTYRNTEGLHTIQYEFEGCILLVNNNHYILRWRSETGRFASYDGIKSEEMEPVSDLWHGLGHKATICVAFYAQVEV